MTEVSSLIHEFIYEVEGSVESGTTSLQEFQAELAGDVHREDLIPGRWKLAPNPC